MKGRPATHRAPFTFTLRVPELPANLIPIVRLVTDDMQARHM